MIQTSIWSLNINIAYVDSQGLLTSSRSTQTPVPVQSVMRVMVYSDHKILALSPLEVRKTPHYGFSWLCDDAAILRTPWERNMPLLRVVWNCFGRLFLLR